MMSKWGFRAQPNEGLVSKDGALRKIRSALDTARKVRDKGRDTSELARFLDAAREGFLRGDYEAAAMQADMVLALFEEVATPPPRRSPTQAPSAPPVPPPEAPTGAKGGSAVIARKVPKRPTTSPGVTSQPYQYPNPQPAPPSGWTVGKVLALVLAVILVACGGIFALSNTFRSPAVPPTSPQGTYSGTLAFRSLYADTEWEGQVSTSAYWLVVNVTFRNTGTLSITFSRLDWKLTDIDGFLIAFPANQFYSEITVPAGPSADVTLVFAVSSYAEPVKVIVSLPNRTDIAVLLS